MRVGRGVSAAVAVLTVLGTTATAATSLVASAAPAMAASNHAAGTWKAASRTGNVRLRGQVPLVVNRNNNIAVQYLQHNPASYKLSLNFGLPLRHKAALNRLIAKQGKTHTQMSRTQIYASFSPKPAQFAALRKWLTREGFAITHIGRDRTAITANAKTSVVQRVLKTQINDYNRRGYTYKGIKVAPYTFYSNTKAPSVPARLGLQSISGLTDIDRFYTDLQLDAMAAKAAGIGNVSPNVTRSPNTRSGGGYYPRDIRAMYDVTGNASGQTVGFTLWGAGETQKAMNDFHTTTGDTQITVDGACTGNGTPFSPSSCTTQQESPDHLVTILENGNLNGGPPDAGNFQYDANDETALDIEQAHGVATGAGMKYYDADCASTVPVGSGLTNAGCNGSDVGLEDAVEDAANDPTLHSVSNSWAYGGDTEYGLNDPFYLASSNSFAIGAAAGTTFYFSTGDSGTFESGYPADSQYVVAVGGTSVFSTTTVSGAATAALSTSDTWAAGGSWCSAIEPRPSWQTGAGVTARAPCPGRITPDISAIADTNTSVFVVASDSPTTDVSGGVGGTSVAAPELNGLEAVTENSLAAQSYPGATPSIGFEGPVMYQLGNGAHYNNYFRDVVCGNTASPSGGPDGDAAQPDWDPATGWGEVDSANYNIGYAQALGATGLSTPASLSHNYAYSCARTPGNASERSISLPTNQVGYSLGAASGGTPWPAKFMPSMAWGAVNTFYKTTDGGATWQTTNSDMLSIACPSANVCVEVGDGGRIRRTTDSGTTWTYVSSPFNKALTKVVCPSTSVCYAAGDRGAVLKSTDGGATWSFLQSVDGNPIYGLSCPTVSVCYATDSYAHVMKTSNGGATWILLSTPVTTPGLAVPGSGGPNPFAGLFGITCANINTCVAVGGFAPTGTDPPIVTTTNGGNNWTLQTSNAGASAWLAGVTCVGSTCYAVGRTGAIVTSTDGGVTWTKMTSNVSTMLNDITCVNATTCIATGQTGTVDVLNAGTWTPTTALAGSVFLSGVTCVNATHCYTAGKQGVTLAFDWTNVSTSAVQQAGGGTTQTMNSISCVDASDCVAVGNAGTIVTTSNAGQTWLPRTSGVSVALTGISCNGAVCEAVGAVTAGAAVVLGSTDSGMTWTPQTSGSTVDLTGLACASSTACVAVGAAGTIDTTSNGGETWTPQTKGTAALNAVACPSLSNCYTVGGVDSGSAVIFASTDGGATWSAQTSQSAQALSAVACANATSCFAAGALGTVVTTVDGGNAWAQQGNPISGPTTALNSGPTGITAVNAAACTSVACALGTASSGNIMTTPLLTVTVNTGGEFGTTPNLTFASNDPAITYDPSSEASNVTGTLTCSTPATSSSDAGTYPVSDCSGLSDDGFSVVYDLADSSYTVGKTSQTITFPPLSNATFGDSDFLAGASSSSGLPIAYSTSSSACTVDPASGNVHIAHAGSCTITASQGGNIDYTAASDVSQSFDIARADQTITFGSLDPKTFGDSSFEIDASASSGLPVSLTVTSGPCSLDSSTSPANVTISHAGSCDITASQDGDSDYNAAPDVDRSFDISKKDQTITFDPLADATYGDPDITLGATASSGLPVSYTPAGGCTVVSGKVHITGAGSCAIDASQAGDGDYNPASDVSRSFSIAKEDQSIDFPSLSDVQFGTSPFAVSATATSGDAVSFSASGNCTIYSGTVTVTDVGTCMVTASQVGDSNFDPATEVSRTFNITKGDQAITFATLPAKTLGAADFTASATTSSGLSVSYTAEGGSSCTVSGSTVHITGVGTCTIDAAQDGNSQYHAAATVSRAFTVNKATPTVQVTASPSHATVGSITYSVSVLGVSGFEPTGSVTVSHGSHHCVINSLSGAGSGSCAILESAGSFTVTAAYAGDSDYTSHSSPLTETVGKGTLTVAFTKETATAAPGKAAKLTITVTITGVAGLTPTGSVTIHDGRGQACTGPVRGGKAHCSFVEQEGLRSITAHYNGDSNYKTATKNIKLVVKG